MKGSTFFAIAVIVTVSIFTEEVKGYAAKCKDMDLISSEQEMMHMNDCLKSINAATYKDINSENVGCFTKCCMDKMGLVDADGKAHKENINGAIGSLWPDADLRKAMQEGIGKCLDTDGSTLKKDDDAKCSSFQPLSACMHAAFMAVCA